MSSLSVKAGDGETVYNVKPADESGFPGTSSSSSSEWSWGSRGIDRQV